MSERAVVKAANAYTTQWETIAAVWSNLDPLQWQTQSAVPGWRVGDLVAHFGRVAQTVTDASTQLSARKPLGVSEYLRTYADSAAEIDEQTRAAGAFDQASVTATTAMQGESAILALASPELQADPVVVARRGPVRWSDFIVTRVIELVAHGDDLARSLGLPTPPTIHRDALQLTVRELAQVLSLRAPGRSVEVRVPPFAAVQCIPGPRHTRGTPGAVIELEPMTFLRLADGRVTWDESVAAGLVRASGQRTEIGACFPLLR
ncbi:MAG: sterol carrier family protein [Candidatus Nanopelagicales bacterium]